ncbi:MAG TPA: MFS transporter [Acidimicrobiales bacterium]|nr:MFS transporter [Acidimicrobiales bacterium]
MPTSHRTPARRAPGPSPLFLAVILAAQLMVVLDTTIVNVALPQIQRALDFSSSGLSWVLNAYILTFGGFLLLGARAGDLVGRRRVFLGGIALFTLSSLGGGLATTGWALLVARALQGVGAALAAPSALSLLTSVFPEGPERVRAIGLYTTVSAAGAAIGLILGGLLTEWVSWRWVMFVNVPIGLAILVRGQGVLAETERRHGRFDLVGALTSTVGMGAVVLGLVEAGTEGWTGGLTVGSFVVGLVLLGLFIRTEHRAEEPILPLRLLANATRTTANVARGLLYAGMYGMFFFLSLFLQDVQGYSSLQTGLAFLPIPAAVFLASQLASRVLVRRLPQKTVMLSGIGLASIGLLLVTRLQLDTSYIELVASLVLLGMGVGISFVSLTSASLANVQPGDAGAASGLVNVSQQIGAATGLAVLVTIFASVTDHAQIGGAAQSVDPAQLEAVLVHGLRTVFGVALVFTVAAFALVAAMVRTLRPKKAGQGDASAEDDEALALLEGYVAEVA